MVVGLLYPIPSASAGGHSWGQDTAPSADAAGLLCPHGRRETELTIFFLP